MALGKEVRLARIFGNPQRRVLTVAIDHVINYPVGLPEGLRNMPATLAGIVEGGADAVTMNKGIAMRYMAPHAGRIPLIVQSMALRPDEPDYADHATVEEALQLGAEAIAVSFFVHCRQEIGYLRHLSAVVRTAEAFGLPVIPHIYPLSSGDEGSAVVHDPEHVYYAARMGVEMGADVVKVPFTGDADSFGEIVRQMAVPVVAAGGPKSESVEQAAAMLREVARSGAAGATVGRNVWGFPPVAETVRYLRKVFVEAAGE
jgi:class I fructose-bisphosphate aldolase